MPTPSSKFVSQTIERIGSQLESVGFRRRKAGIHTRELTKDVLGWVGLNEATHRGDGKLWINPMIGVRHQIVQSEWSRLANEKPHRYAPPTLVTNVGEVGSRHTYKEWAFAEDGDNDRPVDELVRAVCTDGLRFMESVTTLEAMRRHKNLMRGEYLLFTLPLMFALDGDLEHAKETIHRDLKRTKNRKDDAAAEYRAFAKKLLRELESPKGPFSGTSS